eukprot:RCo046231
MADPTQIFIRNLPPGFNKNTLEGLFTSLGPVVESTLWTDHTSREGHCLALVRFPTAALAAAAIRTCSGLSLPNSRRVLEVRLAYPRQAARAGSLVTAQSFPGNPSLQPHAGCGGPAPPSPPQAASTLTPTPPGPPLRPLLPAPGGAPLWASTLFGTAALPADWGMPLEVPVLVHDPVEEGANLFIRRLSRRANKLFLYEMYSPFGAITSIRVEVNLRTGTPKGYAFVQFARAADAHAAMAATNNLQVGEKRLDVSLYRPKPAREQPP